LAFDLKNKIVITVERSKLVSSYPRVGISLTESLLY